MAEYVPPTRYDTPLILLVPTPSSYNGVSSNKYPDDGPIFMASFRTFGGTEKEVNGLYSVENTAVVETWFNPLIKSNCRIKLDSLTYEIIGDPEDINRRHQRMKFKVRRIGGNA